MLQPDSHPGRSRAVALALAVCACLAPLGCSLETSPTAVPPTAVAPELSKSGLGLRGNWLSVPRLFASGPRILSLAATPSRLLATTQGEDAPAKLVAITETGAMEPFASGFAAPPEAACYLEVAPGIGSFSQADVFVSSGSEIWRLSPDGETAVMFLGLPAADGEIAGLAFDTAGSFQYELLALTASGWVYRMDVGGRALRVGWVGAGGRGPSVAPARFGRAAGRLLVAFPLESEVRGLDAVGNVSVVLRWSGVSGAWAVPDDPRAFGATGGALFLAAEPGQIFRYPLGDLAGHAGAVLLSSIHRSGSGIATAEGSSYRLRAFSRFVGAELAAGIVRRPAVTLVTLDVLPGAAAKAILAGSSTPVPVAVLASTGFSTSILDGAEVSLAGAAPISTGRPQLGTYTDLNGDGRLDLVMSFRPVEMRISAGDATLVLEGTALAGDRVRGTCRVCVLGP